MTIVVDAESAPLEQIVKQLNKLINVVKITEVAPGEAVERELMMVTVRGAARPSAGPGRSSSWASSTARSSTSAATAHDHGRGDPEPARRLRGPRRAVRDHRAPAHGPVALPKLERRAAAVKHRRATTDPPSLVDAVRATRRPTTRRHRGPRGEAGHGQAVLRQRRRHRLIGPQGRRPRLRLAGPRPRAEPGGLGESTCWSACARGRRRRPRPRRPGCACCRWPRPPPRPTSS